MEWAELMDSVMVSDSNTIGLLQIMAAVLLPFALCFPIASIYKHVQKNNSYSTSFLMSLYLFAPLASMVTILIGNNVARAFGLVGALSIIRFRNALKDPLDAVFIFWCLVVGMACGTESYAQAVAIVLLCSFMLWVIDALGIARPRYYDSVLKVVTDSKQPDIGESIESRLRSKIKSFNKINEYFDSNSDHKTMVYTLKRRKGSRAEDIEEQIRSIEGVSEIHHLNKESSLFLEARH